MLTKSTCSLCRFLSSPLTRPLRFWRGLYLCYLYDFLSLPPQYVYLVCRVKFLAICSSNFDEFFMVVCMRAPRNPHPSDSVQPLDTSRSIKSFSYSSCERRTSHHVDQSVTASI